MSANAQADEIEDTTKSALDNFFEKMYQKEKKLENQTLLEFNYGVATPSFPVEYYSEEFAPAYQAEIVYGFFRLREELGVANVIKFNSEYAFLGNLNSNLKPTDDELVGITTDSWRFGFGLKDGFGYKIGENIAILPYHSGAWTWTRFDVELPLDQLPDWEKLEKYDETFRFGTYYGGGAIALYGGVAGLSAGYERTIVFRRHDVPKWLASFLIETLLQQWIVYFEDEALNIFGESYPIVYFAYKNLVSMYFYENRRRQMHAPIGSKTPMTVDMFRFGLTFTL